MGERLSDAPGGLEGLRVPGWDVLTGCRTLGLATQGDGTLGQGQSLLWAELPGNLGLKFPRAQVCFPCGLSNPRPDPALHRMIAYSLGCLGPSTRLSMEVSAQGAALWSLSPPPRLATVTLRAENRGHPCGHSHLWDPICLLSSRRTSDPLRALPLTRFHGLFLLLIFAPPFQKDFGRERSLISSKPALWSQTCPGDFWSRLHSVEPHDTAFYGGENPSSLSDFMWLHPTVSPRGTGNTR